MDLCLQTLLQPANTIFKQTKVSVRLCVLEYCFGICQFL